MVVELAINVVHQYAIDQTKNRKSNERTQEIKIMGLKQLNPKGIALILMSNAE